MGTMRERSERVWQLRVGAGVDPITGKRRVIAETVHGSKTSAKKRLAELEVMHGKRSATRTVTVGEVIDEWLALPRLANSTRTKSTHALAHLPAPVRSANAERVTGRDLDKLYVALQAKGVGLPTIRTLHGCIAAAYGQAVKWGWLHDNPARRATPPVAAPSRADAPAAEQLAAIIDAASADLQQSLWIRLSIIVGSRRSELLAVRWSNIDLADATIWVKASLEKDRTVKTTKSNRNRAVALDDRTVKMIRSWQTAQRERAMAAGEKLDRDPYLLSHALDSGTPWRPDGATQLFRRLCKRAGVEGVRLHDLRHGSVSILLDGGGGLPTTWKRAGHSQTSTTANMYGHRVDGADRRAAVVLAAAIDSRGEPNDTRVTSI